MGPYVIHRNKGKGIYEVREENSETPLPGSCIGAHMKQWFEDNNSSEEEDPDGYEDEWKARWKWKARWIEGKWIEDRWKTEGECQE